MTAILKAFLMHSCNIKQTWGRGSNMTAILKAVQSGKINAISAVVISNKPDAPGLETAVGLRSFGVTSVIESKNFHGTRAEYEHLMYVIKILFLYSLMNFSPSIHHKCQLGI